MKVLKITDDVHRDLRMVALSQDKTVPVLASQILRVGLDHMGVPQLAKAEPSEPSEPDVPTHQEPIVDRVR
jgi:hypothetical protein